MIAYPSYKLKGAFGKDIKKATNLGYNRGPLYRRRRGALTSCPNYCCESCPGARYRIDLPNLNKYNEWIMKTVVSCWER